MVPREPHPQALTRPYQPQRALSSNSTKRSFRSYTSSFEADDELSSSADNESMGPDRGFRDGPSQYEGEDTRLTSRKELSGWYAYGFAAEVFVICGMGKWSTFSRAVWSFLDISNGVIYPGFEVKSSAQLPELVQTGRGQLGISRNIQPVCWNWTTQHYMPNLAEVFIY